MRKHEFIKINESPISSCIEESQPIVYSLLRFFEDLNDTRRGVFPTAEQRNCQIMSSTSRPVLKSSLHSNQLKTFSEALSQIAKIRFNYHPKVICDLQLVQDSQQKTQFEESSFANNKNLNSADDSFLETQNYSHTDTKFIHIDSTEEARGFNNCDNNLVIIANNKLTFSILDDTIIYMTIKNASNKMAAYKVVSKFLNKNMPVVQKRFFDLNFQEKKYIDLFMNLGFNDPQKAKNFGTMFNRKSGELLQSVRISSMNMSPFSPDIMTLLMENNFSYKCLSDYIETRQTSQVNRESVNIPGVQKIVKRKYKTRKPRQMFKNGTILKSSSNQNNFSDVDQYVEEISPNESQRNKCNHNAEDLTESVSAAYEQLKESFLCLSSMHDIKSEDIIAMLEAQQQKKFSETFDLAYSSIQQKY
jgi:hypothetical protein